MSCWLLKGFWVHGIFGVYFPTVWMRVSVSYDGNQVPLKTPATRLAWFWTIILSTRLYNDGGSCYLFSVLETGHIICAACGIQSQTPPEMINWPIHLLSINTTNTGYRFQRKFVTWRFPSTLRCRCWYRSSFQNSSRHSPFFPTELVKCWEDSNSNEKAWFVAHSNSQQQVRVGEIRPSPVQFAIVGVKRNVRTLDWRSSTRDWLGAQSVK